MSYKRYILLLSLFAFSQRLFAQNKAIDIQHYCFMIALNDSNNIINGEAKIDFIPKSNDNKVYFDLNAYNSSTEKGMLVTEVREKNNMLKFEQKKDRLFIYYSSPMVASEKRKVTITYSGTPEDGLIISKNKFGYRTSFADNWPERAHNWIPCNDHPSDKASVEFIVTAPDHYQVVGNGIRVEETSLPHGMRLTHWKEDLPLPTKVMAIGVADFAVRLVDTIQGVPLSSWVFTSNRDSGFSQYEVSKNILPFYIHYIGPYPYKKLANVQSKTRFGGLENASNIFYSENSVATDPQHPSEHRLNTEALMAHETAHQWFGDEASETEWQHLWLSEGFATYMTHLYFEYHYGEDTLEARLIRDRKTIIAFYNKRKTPIVDTSAKNDPMRLLNPNTYQKAGWVLHMLRRKLGDRIFRAGIREYYVAYKGKNASTGDFRKVMEKVSRQDLKMFFKQWLYTPGQPVLRGKWHYDAHKKLLSVTVTQMQHALFQFPLQIEIQNNEDTTIKTMHLYERNTTINISLPITPKKLVLDPNVNLLFEGTLMESD